MSCLSFCNRVRHLQPHLFKICSPARSSSDARWLKLPCLRLGDSFITYSKGSPTLTTITRRFKKHRLEFYSDLTNTNFQSGSWILKAIQVILISQVQEPPVFRVKSNICPWSDTPFPTSPVSTHHAPAAMIGVFQPMLMNPSLPGMSFFPYLHGKTLFILQTLYSNIIKPLIQSVTICKLVKLYTLNMYGSLYINYTSIKLLKFTVVLLHAKLWAKHWDIKIHKLYW